jgi:hypothetical protein
VDEQEFGVPEGDEPDNSTIKKLREEIERRDKEIGKAQKALREKEERVAFFETRDKEQAKAKAFSDAGLNPAWAKWFPADQEVDAEKAKEWATTEGLLAAAAAEESEKPPQGFVTPTMQGTPSAGKAKITEAELDKLMKTNPTAAVELANKGLVEWSEKTLQLSS